MKDSWGRQRRLHWHFWNYIRFVWVLVFFHHRGWTLNKQESGGPDRCKTTCQLHHLLAPWLWLVFHMQYVNDDKADLTGLVFTERNSSKCQFWTSLSVFSLKGRRGPVMISASHTPWASPVKEEAEKWAGEDAMARAVRSTAGPNLSRRGAWGGLNSWLIFCSWSTMLSLNKQFENNMLWNREKHSYELLLNPGGSLLESLGSQKLPRGWSWSRWESLPSWDDQTSCRPPTPNTVCGVVRDGREI